MGSRRRDAVALIGALVLVAGSVWIVREIRTSENPVNSATVYAAYVSVATLIVSLLAYLILWWWKGRKATAVPTTAQVTAAADQFAQSMLDTWSREATERRISTPAPARVRWRWGPAEVTSSLVGVSTVPGRLGPHHPDAAPVDCGHDVPRPPLPARPRLWTGRRGGVAPGGASGAVSRRLDEMVPRPRARPWHGSSFPACKIGNHVAHFLATKHIRIL